ncbi:MAG TPA: caspase family protein, partial [Thermoanaerobaculia bacterium]|nr:caspase family protein [Thermoanaerobaculia bacterium]
YAVDDAVDLAYAVALDPATRLVAPERVVLALSGDPQKPQSKANLAALLAAKAVQRPARQSDVITLLESQSRAVGENGMLFVAFATHGINQEGLQYLLMEDSLIEHVGTRLSEAKVREIVSRARVPRSVILVDACRQQLTADTRNGEPDPRSAAALMNDLASVSGQVVLSAAAAGGYAYDDDELRNGVFTAAVIDGLRCRASTDVRGYVTIDTLATYVETRVLDWVRQHRDRDARRATQLYSEGSSKTMPLSICPH